MNATGIIDDDDEPGTHMMRACMLECICVCVIHLYKLYTVSNSKFWQELVCGAVHQISSSVFFHILAMVKL